MCLKLFRVNRLTLSSLTKRTSWILVKVGSEELTQLIYDTNAVGGKQRAWRLCLGYVRGSATQVLRPPPYFLSLDKYKSESGIRDTEALR